MGHDWIKGLGAFTATTAYHTYGGKNLITDGVKYLADNAGAYWLLEAIDRLMVENNITLPMVFSTLMVDLDDALGELVLERDQGETLVAEKILFTDFALPKVEIWTQWYSVSHCYIHMLKSEY